MTETQTDVSPEMEDFKNLFDSRNFVSNSPLNGKRGIVLPGAAFKRTIKPSDPKQEVKTYFVYSVASEVYAKFGGIKTTYLGCGKDAWPAILENGKLKRQEQGPLLAGNIDRKTGVVLFINALKGAKLGGDPTKGMALLDAADFTWKCITKNYGGSIGDVDYDVPAEFHGYVDPLILPTTPDDDFTFADEAPTGNGHATDADVLQAAADTIKSIVASNPAGIQRGQMGLKSAPLLATNPNRIAIQAAMLKDEPYKLAGVVIDANQTVRAATV